MPRVSRPLTIAEILHWIDVYHGATGKWPKKTSGGIAGRPWESWGRINDALRLGLRGLPGGSSLALLLAERRGLRHLRQRPRLTEEQILAWAAAHHERTGAWPTAASGPIPDSGGETWSVVESALEAGTRGLPGGSSLARLLVQRLGARTPGHLPPLTIDLILAWADAYFQRTNAWPHRDTGPVAESPGETWSAVDSALSTGSRGLPGGSSLARLLRDRRGVIAECHRPPWSLPLILEWIDAFFRREGRWPQRTSGPVPEEPGTTWRDVDRALRRGFRQLPGGSSLPQLLARERNVAVEPPQLSRRQILKWADAHRDRTGDWPTKASGPVADAPGETWLAIDAALRRGSRGLRGGSSLARLLAEHRGRRPHLGAPPLSYRKIVHWAEAHHERTGSWPGPDGGPIADAPGETWQAVDAALQDGGRGLPGGTTLLKLLARKRGVRHREEPPPLSVEQILAWADRHYERHRVWPSYTSGPIADAPGETWCGVNSALMVGRRSLPGGTTLAQLLIERRGKPPLQRKPSLREADIVAWARAEYARTGRWPTRSSGPIPESPGDTWATIDGALHRGRRQLAGASSLAQLLEGVKKEA